MDYALPPSIATEGPLWRRLTATFLLALREEYGRTTLVPMTLWNPAYREEIFGLLTRAGERILQVFLDVTPDELRRASRPRC